MCKSISLNDVTPLLYSLKKYCYSLVKVQKFVKTYINGSEMCKSISLNDVIPLLYPLKKYFYLRPQ